MNPPFVDDLFGSGKGWWFPLAIYVCIVYWRANYSVPMCELFLTLAGGI